MPWNARSLVATLCAAITLLAAAPTTAEDTVRVLVPATFSESLADLEESLPTLELVVAASPEDISRLVVDCEAAVGMWSAWAQALVLGIGKELRWVQSSSAGVEGFLAVPELASSDVVLTNAKIIQGPEIGDHAMGLLLTLTRDLKFYTEQMSEGWNRTSRMPLVELRGKTMLVIGLGGIGTQVAERAAAFGMRVLAIDPKDVPYSRAVEFVGKPDQLGELLPEADVVVVCAPRTPATEKMLGRAEFALMKDGVYVINVSRGALIDTPALVAALESGKVRGAGLDVTEPEPLPSDNPLWSMGNVIITPHVAGGSDRVGDRRVDLFRDNIERFVRGRPLINVVDKSKGY